MRLGVHRPRLRRWEDLTANPEWVRQLKDVYGENNIDRLDTMVGLFAETPPEGFGFSDTAFRIFILMASRRLQSDRFLTIDFRPEVYTQVGFDWVNDTSMKDVLLRHYPELEPVIGDAERVFAPWPKLGAPEAGKKSRIVRLADSVRAYMPWG